MKRHLIVSVLASLTMMHMPAHADMVDLPNPDDLSATAQPPIPVQPPPPVPVQPQAPVTNVQNELIGSVVVDSMTRQSGGDLYRIELTRAVNLSRVEIKVLKSRLKITKAEAITDRGQRILLRNLMTAGATETGANLVSENINADIKHIEITGESFSAEADIRVTGFSFVAQPQLIFKKVPPVVNQDPCLKSRTDETLLKTKMDQVALWGQRAESAPGGSTQETFAGNEMDRSVREIVAALRASNPQISTEYLQQLMAFYHQKYQNARSGSRAETAYGTLERSFGDAFAKASMADTNCKIGNMRGGTQELINVASTNYAKYQAAASGSQEETMYLRLAQAAKAKILPAYDVELSDKTNFRKLEQEYKSNLARYQAVPSGSFLESIYSEMGNKALVRALLVLKRQVGSMDVEQRYAMIEEYQKKYQAAPSGSADETFADKVLKIVSQ